MHSKKIEAITANTTASIADLEAVVKQTRNALETTYTEIKAKTENGINNLQVKLIFIHNFFVMLIHGGSEVKNFFANYS